MASARSVCQTLGAGRALLGIALLVAPDRVTAGWVGDDGATAAGRVLARGLGARDLLLGLGALTGPAGTARTWIAAGVAADVADTLISGSSEAIPRNGRVGTTVVAGGAALVGAWLLRALD